MSSLSVIVTTYLRDWALELCLTALAMQKPPPMEVIVVEDGGPHMILPDIWERMDKLGIEELARLKDRVSYAWHPHNEYGVSKCRNQGARMASGSGLVFLDSDIMLRPGALAAYAEMLDKNPNRAIGGYYRYLPPMRITRRDVMERWDDIWEMRLPQEPLEQPWIIVGLDVREAVGQSFFFEDEDQTHPQPLSLIGGNLCIPREIFEKTNGWNEEFRIYGGEDAEMSLQIADLGYPFSYSLRAGGAHIAHERNLQRAIEGTEVSGQYIRKHYPHWFKDGKGLWEFPNFLEEIARKRATGEWKRFDTDSAS